MPMSKPDFLLAINDPYPPQYSLRSFDSPVRVQMDGTCAPESVCALYENLLNQKGPSYSADLSATFLYALAHRASGLPAGVAGSNILTVLEQLMNYGVCPEEHWPFRTNNVILEQPSPKAQEKAIPYYIEHVTKLTSLAEMKRSISLGHPVVGALDKHAVLLVAYNETHFFYKNSLGTEWNGDGYGEVSLTDIEKYSHLTNCWTMFLRDEVPEANPMLKHGWYRALMSILIWVQKHIL